MFYLNRRLNEIDYAFIVVVCFIILIIEIYI